MFGFLPHKLFTGHNGANTSGLSPRLWNRITGSLMAADGDKRLFLVGDDFGTVKAADTYTDLFSEMAYTSYIDTGGTLTGLADENCGALKLASDGTANDEIWLEAGDGTQQLGRISDTAGADFLTAFEIRFKVTDIDDNDNSWFVGLATPGMAKADTLVDTTGVLDTDQSFIGFRNLLNGDNAMFTYQKASQTVQNKLASFTTSAGATFAVAADTYMKMGFIYDPSAIPAKRITVYVNNVEQGTYVTATNIAATTFPDAVALNFLAGFKNVTAAATELDIDWWAFAQVV